MRQLAVAPHVRQVAPEDDQIGVRSVRLRDGDPEERILRVARRDVYVGEEDGAERIGGTSPAVFAAAGCGASRVRHMQPHNSMNGFFMVSEQFYHYKVRI